MVFLLNRENSRSTTFRMVTCMRWEISTTFWLSGRENWTYSIWLSDGDPDPHLWKTSMWIQIQEVKKCRKHGKEKLYFNLRFIFSKSKYCKNVKIKLILYFQFNFVWHCSVTFTQLCTLWILIRITTNQCGSTLLFDTPPTPNSIPNCRHLLVKYGI